MAPHSHEIANAFQNDILLPTHRW